ncbi:MAG: UDP-N-acetylmuramate--L-alanine ligase [Phycisphaerae bacterium]
MPEAMDRAEHKSPPAETEAPPARRCVHLIGIGGAGMRALAAVLLDRGGKVSGSDSTGGGAVDRLRESGAAVEVGQRAENIPQDCDLVVYSAAIHEQNPELLAARRRRLEVVKYSEMLGRLMSEHVGIAIAGTHGKSTTTAMVAWALRQAGADPSFIIGATAPQLGGPSGVGSGRHFVAEACEFDRSFLHLRPTYAAILNVEEDHLDCYRDIDAIIEAFRAFAGGVDPAGMLVVAGDDRNALAAAQGARCEVQTFGLSQECTWRGETLGWDHGRADMRVFFNGGEYARLRVPLPGQHNCYNTLAAAALLHHAGLEPRQVGELLAAFAGTQRRMTLKGVVGGVTVLDDYAHHPTEIQATLRAIRDAYEPRRLVCVFQPHQHSRTRFLLKDFARSFALADEVIVPEIYFVRDSEREKDYICSEDLVAQIRLHGGAAVYLENFEDIASYLHGRLDSGDAVVTVGAGNIWELADEIVRRLG